jgi:thioredoxin reductase (NADPH)
MDWDVLIAGGGPAGMTAAIYSARAGWKTVVIDPLGGGGQASTTDVIHNYPGFPSGVSGAGLMDLMTEQAKSFGAAIEFDVVTEIARDGAGFTVKCESLTRTARAIIYAAGTSPKKLGVPGEEKFTGRGISFCATCDGALFKDKVVAVAGGGDSALTEAEFLTRFAGVVLIIHRRDEFRAGLAAIRRVTQNPKVRMLMSTAVQEVCGEGKVASIIVKDLKSGRTSEVQVDGLFLYVGSTPNVAPVKDLVDVAESGYVETDDDMSTRTPGLFVAGDIREKSLRQVATAVGDGATAAWSAERYLLESALSVHTGVPR